MKKSKSRSRGGLARLRTSNKPLLLAVSILALFAAAIGIIGMNASAYEMKKDSFEDVPKFDYQMASLPTLKDATVTAKDNGPFSKGTYQNPFYNDNKVFNTVTINQALTKGVTTIPGSVDVRWANVVMDEQGKKYDILLNVSHVVIDSDGDFPANTIAVLTDENNQVWLDGEQLDDSGKLPGHAKSMDATIKVVEHATDTPVKGTIPLCYVDLDVGAGMTNSYAPDGTSIDDVRKNYPYIESVEILKGQQSDVHTTSDTLIRTDPTKHLFWGTSETNNDWDEQAQSGIIYLGDASGTSFRYESTGSAGIALFNKFGLYNITSSKTGDGTITDSSTAFLHSDKTYTMKAGDGSIISSITVDGKDVPVTNTSEMTYDFTDIKEDHKISVVFTKQNSVSINYVDDSTNTTLYTKTGLTGTTGTAIPYKTDDDIKKYTDQGYKLVSSDYPADPKFTDDASKTYTVHLTPIIETVTEGTLKTTSDTMTPGGKKYPKGLDKDSLAFDWTRTIHYVDQSGNKLFDDVKQSVHVARTATVNHVTSEVKYADYARTDNSGEHKVDADVASPAKEGMTPDKASVDKVALGSITKAENLEVTVTYAADMQKAIVHFKDEQGNKIAEDLTQTGASGSTISIDVDGTISKLGAQGWTKVSNDYKNGLTFDNDKSKDQEFAVVMKHNIEADGSEQKTVNRTIKYQYEDQKQAAPDKTDSVTFSREVSEDKVTKEKIYGKWQNGRSGTKDYPAVTSPVIAGYTADKPIVASSTPKPDDGNTEVVVTYIADGQSAKISFITSDGKKIAEDLTDAGKSNTKMKMDPSKQIEELESHGYKLVSNDYPKDATFDSDSSKDQSFTVKMDPIIETVIPKDPKNPDEPMNPDGTTYPDGLKADDLSHDVKQTIHYVDNNQKSVADDHVATLHFERIATVNHVTKEVVYKDWTPDSGKFDAVVSPKIDNMKASLDAVVAVNGINHESKDIETTVIYSPETPQPAETPAEPSAPEAPKVVQTGDVIAGVAGVAASAAAIGAAVFMARRRR